MKLLKVHYYFQSFTKLQPVKMQRQEIFSIENTHDSIPEIEVVEFQDSKKNSNKFISNLKKSILEYCSVSSINCFIHLNSHGVLSRILWFILLVLSMIGGYFTIVSLLGVRESLILHEDNTISTSDIPFPAITVCSTAKADHRKVNYREMISKLDESIL